MYLVCFFQLRRPYYLLVMCPYVANFVWACPPESQNEKWYPPDIPPEAQNLKKGKTQANLKPGNLKLIHHYCILQKPIKEWNWPIKSQLGQFHLMLTSK